MRSQKSLLILGFMASLFIGRPLFAEVVAHLYSAEVMVTGQSEKDRNLAMQQALAQVLIKLTGDEKILQTPEIKKITKQSTNYAQDFTYISREQTPGKMRLQVNFNPKAIDELLLQAKISRWSADRPMLLSWFVVRDNSGLSLVDSEHRAALHSELKEALKQYGLPYVFPIMDISTLTQITPQMIWDGKQADLAQQVEAYHPDATLLIKLSQDAKASEAWTAQANLHWGEKNLQFEAKRATPELALKPLVAQVAWALAQAKVVETGTSTQQNVALTVQAINDADTLQQMLTHLKKITADPEIDVLGVQSDTVQLSLAVSGGAAGLNNLLKHDILMVPVSATDASKNEDSLTYRWQPQ